MVESLLDALHEGCVGGVVPGSVKPALIPFLGEGTYGKHLGITKLLALGSLKIVPRLVGAESRLCK